MNQAIQPPEGISNHCWKKNENTKTLSYVGTSQIKVLGLNFCRLICLLVSELMLHYLYKYFSCLVCFITFSNKGLHMLILHFQDITPIPS